MAVTVAQLSGRGQGSDTVLGVLAHSALAFGLVAAQPFACTVLLSRRLYPDAPNHKLGTLAEFHALARNGRAHRALSDAEVTAELLLRIQRDLRQRHGVDAPDHDFLQALQQCSKATLPRFWQRQAGATA